MAKSYVELGKRFAAILKYFKDLAESNMKLGKNQGPKTIDLDLNGWSGSSFDSATLHKLYSRQEHAAEMQHVLSGPETSGVVGDLTAIQLQADFLAGAERAHYARGCSYVRARIHAAARKQGHQHPNGVLEKGVRGTVTTVLAKAKAGA